MRKNLIIILSGTPASGKDTITREILQKYPCDFMVLRKHKTIKESQDYVPISEELFKEKILHGEFMEYHGRYGNYYGADKNEANKIINKGFIPIVHNGHFKYIFDFLKNDEYTFFNIYLECNEKNAMNRLLLRNDKNINDRIDAYKEERYDYLKFMQNSKNELFNLILDTNKLSPEESAKLIYKKTTQF